MPIWGQKILSLYVVRPLKNETEHPEKENGAFSVD